MYVIHLNKEQCANIHAEKALTKPSSKTIENIDLQLK